MFKGPKEMSLAGNAAAASAAASAAAAAAVPNEDLILVYAYFGAAHQR